MWNRAAKAISLLALFVLAGCMSEDRWKLADAIAARGKLVAEEIPTATFRLTARHRLDAQGGPLTVYIEGDGFAWANRRRPSNNPTPFEPIALRLAAVDPAPNVVHLARPCQYTDLRKDPLCGKLYWTDGRYADVVVVAMIDAIDRFASRIGATRIHLVGYSGGAAIAAFVAVNRHDVVSFTTVAGNLDHDRVHDHHEATRLEKSLNPIETAPAAATIPQRHFVGAEDDVIPPFIARAYVDAMPENNCARLVLVKGMGHDARWARFWPRLMNDYPPGCTRPAE